MLRTREINPWVFVATAFHCESGMQVSLRRRYLSTSGLPYGDLANHWFTGASVKVGDVSRCHRRQPASQLALSIKKQLSKFTLKPRFGMDMQMPAIKIINSYNSVHLAGLLEYLLRFACLRIFKNLM